MYAVISWVQEGESIKDWTITEHDNKNEAWVEYENEKSLGRKAWLVIIEARSDVVEVCRKNTYIGINDGYGVIGYKFECLYCEKESTMFVDEEEEKQECEYCGKINNMIAIKF